jgi:hypothetical protein
MMTVSLTQGIDRVNESSYDVQYWKVYIRIYIKCVIWNHKLIETGDVEP